MTYEVVDMPVTGTADDIIESLPADAIPPADDAEYCDTCHATHACEVCGRALAYSGRGRHPKRCDEHKKRQTAGTTTVRSSGRGWQAPLQAALTNQVTMIGVMVYPFENFDGQVIMTGAEPLAQSLVALAESNPSIRRNLERLVAAGAWSQVIAATAQIAIPILMHHNIMPAMRIPGMTPA